MRNSQQVRNELATDHDHPDCGVASVILINCRERNCSEISKHPRNVEAVIFLSIDSFIVNSRPQFIIKPWFQASLLLLGIRNNIVQRVHWFFFIQFSNHLKWTIKKIFQTKKIFKKLCLVQNFAFLYIYLYLHYFFVSILAMLEDILYNFLKFMMDLKRALKSCKFRILI